MAKAKDQALRNTIGADDLSNTLKGYSDDLLDRGHEPIDYRDDWDKPQEWDFEAIERENEKSRQVTRKQVEMPRYRRSGFLERPWDKYDTTR